MSLGNAFELDILNAFLLAVAVANYVDNAASSPRTNIACGLYTADPGEAGTMSTSEATYGSYARVNNLRSVSGWTTPASGATSPQANIQFAACTSSTNTITHFGLGDTAGGASKLIASGAASPNVAVSTPIAPYASTATTFTFD